MITLIIAFCAGIVLAYAVAFIVYGNKVSALEEKNYRYYMALEIQQGDYERAVLDVEKLDKEIRKLKETVKKEKSAAKKEEKTAKTKAKKK